MFEQLDLKFLDAKFRLRGAKRASEEIAIVEIDRASIHEIGKWPWSRKKIAELVDRVSAGQPKVIGLDILFSQPDPDPENDETLARSLENAGNVVLSYYFILSKEDAEFQSPEEFGRQLENISRSAIGIVSNLRGVEAEPDSVRVYGVETNSEPISRAAAGEGYYNVQLGPDGVVRRIPLTVRANGKNYLAFSAAIFKVALRDAPCILRLDGEKILSLRVGSSDIPTSGNGMMLIDYCGAGKSFRTYPAARVLDGTVPPETFAAGIVLIGGTSIGDFEMRLTPFSMNTPSVVIHANAIDDYLRGRMLTVPYCSYLIMAMGIAGLALLPGIILPRVSRIAYGALLALAAGLCWLVFDFYLFSAKNIQVNTLYPLLSLLTSYTAVSLLVGVSQERNERRLARGIRSMGEIIESTHDIDSLMQRILYALLLFLGARRGFILLRAGEDEAGRWGQWEVKASRGMGEDLPGGSGFAPYAKIISLVEKSGDPLLIPQKAWRTHGLSREPHATGYRPGFLLCMPLNARGRLNGIAYADGKKATPPISAESLPIISSIAGQLGTAIENASLYSEVREVREREAGKEVFVDGAITRDGRFGEIVGSSEIMRKVLSLVERAAVSDSTVLIEGETGTGKELIARAVHFYGPRREKKFIAQNCAALPEALLESELFGHVKGAFTGAVTDKKGLFVVASGGTIFLDEVAECSSAVQAKLLRAVQDGVIRPLGGTREVNVNVRIISATNRNLEEETGKGHFRKDLYYRLNIFPVMVPPLRERREDIPQLADYFLSRYSEKAKKPIEGFTNEAMRLLVSYDFPGNVRELENEIERIVAMHRGGKLITAGDLSKKVGVREEEPGWKLSLAGRTLKETLRDLESQMIIGALKSCDGNITQAANKLGMSRYGLYKKIAKHGISLT